MVNQELKAEDDLVTPVLLGGGKTAGIPTLKLDPIDTLSGSNKIRVRFKNHAMYDTDNNVKITGVKGEVGGSALNGAMTSATTGTVNVDDSSNWPTNGYVKIDDEIIKYTGKPSTTSITILASPTGRAQDSTVAAAHEDNSLVQLYMIGVNATTSPYGSSPSHKGLVWGVSACHYVPTPNLSSQEPASPR